MNTEPSPLLTAPQVADMLRLKLSTVYDAAGRGLLPHVRLWHGKRRSVIRFRREEIEKLIRERSVPASARS